MPMRPRAVACWSRSSGTGSTGPRRHPVQGKRPGTERDDRQAHFVEHVGDNAGRSGRRSAVRPRQPRESQPSGQRRCDRRRRGRASGLAAVAESCDASRRTASGAPRERLRQHDRLAEAADHADDRLAACETTISAASLASIAADDRADGTGEDRSAATRDRTGPLGAVSVPRSSSVSCRSSSGRASAFVVLSPMGDTLPSARDAQVVVDARLVARCLR